MQNCLVNLKQFGKELGGMARNYGQHIYFQRSIVKKRDAKILLFIQGLTHANQMLKSCWSSVPGWSKHGK